MGSEQLRRRVAGGGIGWAIDSASGADNKYDGSVNLALAPARSGTTALVELSPMFTGTEAGHPNRNKVSQNWAGPALYNSTNHLVELLTNNTR